MASLHFRIGPGAASLLVDIAREHLKYNYDGEKAVGAITGSLHGIERQMALDIITGKVVLGEDVEEQQFVAHNYHPINDKDYERFDPEEWAEDELLRLRRESKQWLKALAQMKQRIISRGGNYHIDFEANYKDIIKYAYEGKRSITFTQEFVEDKRLEQIAWCIGSVKNFVEHGLKATAAVRWLCNNYSDMPPELGCEANTASFRQVYIDLFDMIHSDDAIIEALRKQRANDVQLKAYIDGQRDIYEKYALELRPDHILDGFDAGWLAPNGDFYGLNGEIANMLHNQIADKLLDAGIVPASTRNDHSGNPDRWLEEHGWVKIHGDWILFDGYNLYERGLVNLPVHITDEQRKAIVEYGKKCCNNTLQFGFKKIIMRPDRFAQVEDLMLHKLFNF